MWARAGAGRLVDEVVGREGIEPPQSKTADLQSAELTTCSTYPRMTPARGASPTGADGIRPMGPPQPVRAWSRGCDSNPQPSVYKTDALPLSYLGAHRVYRLVTSGAGWPVLHLARSLQRREGLLDGEQDR